MASELRHTRGPNLSDRRTLLDRAIEWVSPSWGLQRAMARAASRRWSAIGGATGYRSATPSRIGEQQAGSGGGDFHLEYQEHRIRVMERARQLCRDNPIAIGVLNRVRDSVIGDGHRPQARTEDKKWNAQAESLWRAEEDEPADDRRLFTPFDIMRHAFECFIRDGEVLLVKLKTGALHVVEADRLSAPPGMRYSPHHVDGIDLDPATGKPLRYYIAQRGPDETYNPSVVEYPERWVVSADHVMHFARRDRASATRGISAYASVSEWLESLERYVEASVVSARMAACVGLLIQSSIPVGPDQDSIYGSSGVQHDRWDIEPGMVRELMPGEDVRVLEPKQPITGFDAFLKTYARLLGLPFDMPIEMVLLDFSQGSYSSVRGAMTIPRRSAISLRRQLRQHLLAPWWRWRVDVWIASGALADRPDKYRHGWIAPGAAQLDPIKEVQAQMMELDAGLITHSEALAQRGVDFDEFLSQREEEQRRLDACGLVFAASTATRDRIAAEPAPEPEPEEAKEAEETEAADA